MQTRKIFLENGSHSLDITNNCSDDDIYDALTFVKIESDRTVEELMEVWHKCEGDFDKWYSQLPSEYEALVRLYYMYLWQEYSETNVKCSKDSLVHFINKVSHIHGGQFIISGILKGNKNEIIIEQTEWHETVVCFLGGFNNPVRVIDEEKILEKLPELLNLYFDSDTTFIINLYY